jgi:hypothetical protein
VLDTDKDLWAASALLLASKYIELDDNIPFIQDLRSLGLKAYSTEIFIKSEKVFLKALNWELMIITPLHFAECILNHWAIFGDDRIKLKDINENEIYRYASNIEFEYEADKKDQLNAIISSIKRYTEFFWDVTIQSFDVQVYSYAVQGLYAVLAAREVMGIRPVWNKQYDQFTGLNKHHYKAQIDEIKVKINENKILSTLVNVVNQNWYKTSVPSPPSQVTEDATSSEVSSRKTDKSKSLKNSCLEKHKSSRESFNTRNYTHFDNFSSCSGATKENQKAEFEKMTMIANAAANKHQQRKSFMRKSSTPAHKVETKSTRASSRIVINLAALGNVEKKENEFSNYYGQTKISSFMSTVDSIFAKKKSVAAKDTKAVCEIKVSRYSLYDNNLVSQRSNTKNNDTCTSRSIKKTDVYTTKHLKRAKSKASNIKEFSKTFYSRGVSSRYQKSRNGSKISIRNNGSDSRPRCDNKVNKNGFMSVHNRICKIKPVRPESNPKQHKNFIKSNIKKISTYWDISKYHKVVNKERSSSKLGSRLKSSILGKSKVYKINDRAVDHSDVNNITTAELVSVSSNFGKKNSMVSRAQSNNVNFSKNAAVSNISQYKRHVHGKKSVDLFMKRPRDKENVNWLSIHATNKTQKFGRRNLSTIINNEHHQ